MRVVDRFHAGHRTRVNRPVFGRHRNLRFQPAPRRMFVVEIHSIVAFRSDRKTGCRVVRTYSEKICAAAFSPRAWTYASATRTRSEEHTSELQSLMRISYAVFCLKKKRTKNQ